MKIFVSVGGAIPNTATSIVVVATYFVGASYGTSFSLPVTMDLATVMNTNIMNACIADAALNGYTVGLLDTKCMQGGFVGL